MPKPPAFQFYVKDWVMSTRTIPAEARGVHIDLICFSWEEEGLPADLDGLHTYVGLTERKFKSIWDAHLARRWTSDGNGRLVHRKVEEEREKQLRWREKSAKGGRKSRKGA